MGEKQNQPFQLSFNASLKVDLQGSRVTSAGGLILVRELDWQDTKAPTTPSACPKIRPYQADSWKTAKVVGNAEWKYPVSRSTVRRSSRRNSDHMLT